MSDGPPSLFGLIEAGLVREPTATAMLDRLEPTAQVSPAYIEREAFETLTVLCARLRPRTFRPTALELALQIDARVAKGEGDGWRYDAMPPDGVAYVEGLASVDDEAMAVHGLVFANLDGAAADALIRALQRGETRTEWRFPVRRFFEELLTEVAVVAYAQPCAQAMIGYVGYADAKGWTQVDLNGREGWER